MRMSSANVAYCTGSNSYYMRVPFLERRHGRTPAGWEHQGGFCSSRTRYGETSSSDPCLPQTYLVQSTGYECSQPPMRDSEPSCAQLHMSRHLRGQYTASESFCVPNTGAAAGGQRARQQHASTTALLMTGGYFLTPPPVAATLSPVLRPMTAMLPAGRLAALVWTELLGLYPSPGPFAPAGRAGSTTRRRLHRASLVPTWFCQPRLLRVGAGGCVGVSTSAREREIGPFTPGCRGGAAAAALANVSSTTRTNRVTQLPAHGSSWNQDHVSRAASDDGSSAVLGPAAHGLAPTST
ncbi:hypothetical protein TgHK011_005804 [Trichoderma gracile]|nr:hypothetical protein TgHK011_005804 [Trichoderma gracile]